MIFKRSSNLWLKWTLYCGLGEFLGITTAAIIAVTINTNVGDPNTFIKLITVFAAVIMSGIFEGAITGFLQAKILSKVFSINIKRWITLTASVAVIGWLAGTIPSTVITSTQNLNDSAQPTLFQMLIYAALLGLVAGTAFGFAQWFELKHHVQKASRWIVANAIAWAIAMIIIFTAATLPDINTPIPIIILLGCICGLLAGLILGAITGFQLIKFHKIQT